MTLSTQTLWRMSKELSFSRVTPQWKNCLCFAITPLEFRWAKRHNLSFAYLSETEQSGFFSMVFDKSRSIFLNKFSSTLWFPGVSSQFLKKINKGSLTQWVVSNRLYWCLKLLDELMNLYEVKQTDPKQRWQWVAKLFPKLKIYRHWRVCPRSCFSSERK